VNPLLAERQMHGNQAMQHLLKSRVVQTKLKIGQPDDEYEREADRVAEQVMRMPLPRRASSGILSNQRICPMCEEEKPRRQPIEEEALLQAKGLSGQKAETTPDLQSHIDALRVGGQPLAESERAFFEPRFGYDLSRVRVHSDSRASEVADLLNARAFTLGQHIAFGAGQYNPRIEKGQRLLAHELVHAIQQISDTPSPIGYKTQSDRRGIACEAVLNELLIQMEEGEREEEVGAETRQVQQEINVALYDRNPAHMHPGSSELQAFHGWAAAWGRDYNASSHAVRTHDNIREALIRVIELLPPDGIIGTIACFGHGSSSSGWIGMGDIGDVLLDPDIRNKLSSNLRVILYMCLTGASPESRLPTIEQGGEEPARRAGGMRSFAARLRNRLAEAQIGNAEVWAHTVEGVAVTSPHWRVFADEGAPGEAFFSTVFDMITLPIEFLHLSMRYQRLDDEARARRVRRKEFPTSSADLIDRWMWNFYLNLVRGEEIATRIPMDPERCRQEILLNWRSYRNGNKRVLIPGKIGYNFLNANDFEDLPHLA